MGAQSGHFMQIIMGSKWFEFVFEYFSVALSDQTGCMHPMGILNYTIKTLLTC